MVTVTSLRSKEQTGAEMRSLVRQYSSDLRSFQYQGRPLDEMQFRDYFDLVKRIPYRQNPKNVEIVTRPFHILTIAGFGDCKSKAILIASWLEQNQIPWRFVSVSSREDGRIHHVIVEADAGDGPQQIDATYLENQVGDVTRWTNVEPLSGAGAARSSAPVLVSMYGNGAPSLQMTREFLSKAEQMGAIATGGILTLIGIGITATAGVIVSIIGAVSAKRQQIRAAEQATRLVEAQAQIRAEQMEDVEEIEAKRAEQTATLLKWGIPAGIAAALFLI